MFSTSQICTSAHIHRVAAEWRFTMDWIRGLQRAIDYMEENMTQELDYSRIAERAYSSSYHFQRTINLLTGMTVGEYIRNRRLSLAGEELVATGVKVIDLAYKYGYDTPESFTKAFSRFHGITPSAARHEGARLKSFNRLSITISLKGGNVMEYQILKRESFPVLVKAEKFSIDTSNVLLPKYWEKAYKNGLIKTLCENGSGSELLGLCEPENKGEKCFRYGIGIECGRALEVPEGFEIWNMPAQTWAVFKVIGAMPEAIQTQLKRIYAEFFPQSEYEPVDDIDFEAYPDGDNRKADYVSYIWIPVKKKQD
jgi:AraC family transcriptional regulator